MNIYLLPLLIMGLMCLPATLADKIDMPNPVPDSSNPLSKQLENAVKTSKEGRKLGDIDPADKNESKPHSLMTKQIGSTKAYDKLEEAALMQTFPFLEQAEKKAIDDFKDLLHDPRLTKGELHKERENWANSQPADVQTAYRKWELEKKENKKNAIAHTEKIVESVSPETKALYEKIKAVVMNLNMTRKQECELIRQVMEAAEQKVQDEFFEKINMNLVSYCLKRSQPQSVRSVSIDQTSSNPPINIQPVNPVSLSNDQTPISNSVVDLPSLPQNQLQNNSRSSSESQEQKLQSFSRSDSASSETFDNYPKKHRKNHLYNRGWSTRYEYPRPHHHHFLPDYSHLLYAPVVHPAYLPPGYIHPQFMQPQPYEYVHKPHSHHSLKYLKKKLQKYKGKKNKKISISSSSSSESESKSESQEKQKKKHKKNKKVEKIASSEEKEQKSEENMEKEQKSDTKNIGHKSKSSSNGSSASSSGVSNSNESDVNRPKKTKKKHNKPIKFFKPENAPEPQVREMKNDTGVEGLQAKQEPIEKPKLEYGQQKPNQDPKIEDIQLATAADELKPEQVQNTEEHVNVGENAAESNLQNVTKQKEDKKEITGQTDAIGTIGDPK